MQCVKVVVFNRSFSFLPLIPLLQRKQPDRVSMMGFPGLEKRETWATG
jgi:hypothetical protein